MVTNTKNLEGSGSEHLKYLEGALIKRANEGDLTEVLKSEFLTNLDRRKHTSISPKNKRQRTLPEPHLSRGLLRSQILTRVSGEGLNLQVKVDR